MRSFLNIEMLVRMIGSDDRGLIFEGEM